MTPPDDEFDPKETARRRDEVIRRMANTPPRHETKSHPRKKGKRVGPARKGRDRGKP